MDIKKLINTGNVTIIDVRESWEYDEEHVEDAVNIPLGDLSLQPASLRSFKEPFILYCRSGNRSAQAVTTLRAHGFREVYNAGSMEDVRILLHKKATHAT